MWESVDFKTSAGQDADVEPGGLGVGGEGVQVDHIRNKGWSSRITILTLMLMVELHTSLPFN